jgi:hypothetical protein
MSNYAIVVNTHSSSIDVLKIFLNQLEKHYPNNKVYIFTDKGDGIDLKYNLILYNSNDKFRTQYLNSIKQVSEDFILYLNEDYILYDYVNKDKIANYLSTLENNQDISFIRLTRGPNMTTKKMDDDLFLADNKLNYFFSQTAAIWKRESLIKIHENGPDTHIGIGGATYGHFEIDANKVCRDLDIKGLVAYNGEKLRGMYHYDSSVFPYISTAIIKGKWNLSEYKEELSPLIKEYNINVNIRGQV